MTLRAQPITAEEFLTWPDEPGRRQELIRGQVISMPLSGAEHGSVTAEIGVRLAGHAAARGLGTVYAAGTGFVVERDPDTVLGADVAFIAEHRLHEITRPDDYLPFAPDLAVEVTSPEEDADVVDEQVRIWLAAGSRLVWNVDPVARTVTVHRPGARPILLTETDEIDGADVLPGFRCRVADFFA